MTFARLLRRRARAQLGLLALVGVIAALVSATLVAVLGYVALSAQAGLTAALHDAGPTGAAMQVATPRSRHDAAAQVAAGEEVLARTLHGMPVVVQRSHRSTELTVDGGGAGVVVAAEPGLAAQVGVVEGVMPPEGGTATAAAPVPATLSRATAAMLGVAPGDRLTLLGASESSTPLEVEVAAVWEPTDPGDPRWFGEADGAVWVDETALDGVPATVRVRWTLVPDDGLAPGRVPELRRALAATLAGLKADDAVDELGVLGTDGLDTTLADVDRTLSTVRALSLPATLLAALVGAVVLGQLAALLTEVRRGELVLLRSRGASRGRVVGAAVVEGAVVGVVGSAVGGALAVAGLRGLGVVSSELAVGAPAGVAAGVALVFAGATWVRVRGPLREERADRPLRGSALLGVLALVLAAAGLGLWRLLSMGTPVRTVGGRAAPDPLAGAALALSLLAIALLAAALVPAVARTTGRWAARRPGLGVLAVQQVARRPTAHAATAALTGLAVATAVVVSGFLGSWALLQADRAAVETGADLRVTPDDPADVTAALAAATTADPGATVVSAATTRVTLGAVTADLVAVPRDAWPRLHRAPQDEVPGTAGPGADPAAAGDTGLPLPPGATTLTATVTVTDTSATGQLLGRPGVAAWVRTAPGTLVPVDLTLHPDPDAPGHADATTWSAPLPAGATALAAVDVHVDAAADHRVEVTGLATDAGPLGAATWRSLLVGREANPLPAGPDDAGAVAHVPAGDVAPGTTVRLAAVPGGPLPVVAGEELAAALSLSVGDTTTLVVPGHRVEVEVAEVVAAVPGSADPVALLADLDAWSGAQLWTGSTVDAPGEVWAWPADGPSDTALPAALERAGIAADVVRAEPRATPLLDPALTAFRVATWATVALAAGGVLAAARASARARRPETGALRGVGVPGRTQAALRVAEQVRVLVPAALAGAVGGAGLALLVAQPLVDALDGGTLPLPVEPGLDVVALATWLGATALAVALVVAASARDTARRARTASPRAEVAA
ncbi:hypothetical protein [Cellulomonas sp. C5510]|uniref:hypothetical protein n=1 Tax=Cellulomonas sp. C5510 TaxID=2871170 RepID=UPI001C942AFE|nr:hypothetical protein [Cellulomonas sp. C5510]QZN85184.1 hypothetical protein K5O09_15590 [Cellulomonas sp. C5510]